MTETSSAIMHRVDTDLARLMRSFRTLQTQHARVLHHESAARGLNATDTRFVFFLAAADGDGVTPKQAGEYLELSTGSMTSLIDRLEQRFHLERRPNLRDRRSVFLHLTASGTSIAREVGAVYTSAFRHVVAPEDREQLADALDRMGAALGGQGRTTAATATAA